jgi:hypothetical protein
MIDHINTCKKIDIHYLTWTFILRSNLGQTSLNMTKPAHSDLRTLYVLVIIWGGPHPPADPTVSCEVGPEGKIIYLIWKPYTFTAGPDPPGSEATDGT